MHLKDIDGFSAHLATSSIGDDPFWVREHTQVTELDIQLFYSQCRQRGGGACEAAVAAIDTLQACMIRASFDRRLTNPSSAIILHELPPSRFLVDELVAGLAHLSESRRRACLWALEMNVKPDDVATMTWADLQRTDIAGMQTPLAMEITTAVAKTPHIRIPYVFWEWASPEIAAPLLRLTETIEVAFECTWPALQAKYKDIALVDRAADSASLLELARGI